MGLGIVIYTCNPTYSGGGGRRISVQGQQGGSMRPYLKNTQRKGWNVAQVVHMSCSSSSSCCAEGGCMSLGWSVPR